MNTLDGGPAFPQPYLDGATSSGMSLRDLFAAFALAALVAKAPFADAPAEASDPDFPALARGAYLYADAMLAVRDEGLSRAP
jgi:hypothetical protein